MSNNGMYRRFADDFRFRYRQSFGHDAPRSCDDYAIVGFHNAARLNKLNYTDQARVDEVLLNMLYWVNPAIRPETGKQQKDWLHHE